MAASLSSASAAASGGSVAGSSEASVSASASTSASAPQSASAIPSATNTGAASLSNEPPTSSKPSSPRPGPTPTIPQRDKETLNRVLVDRFVTRDWIHSAALKDAQMNLENGTKQTLARISDYKTLREGRNRLPPGKLYGEGYSGFGNGYTETGGPVKLVYPSQKPRPGKRTTPSLKPSRKDIKKQAEQHEELVPIRIDVDVDKVKLRDTFTFNLHERLIPVDLFAAQLVEDMGLKHPLDKPVHEQVINQMWEQLQDFYPFAYSEEDALDPELPYSAYKNDEMRILVKLNITIGMHTLVDQFEWEINNPMNSPEEFAASMARDLSLSGEFTTAIAHCIREQAQLFTRSLYSIGHPFDGRPIEDADLVAAFLPSPLPSVFRPQQQAKDFAPYLYENTEAELERTETMFSREQRRQKRSVNRRGGPQLPDLKDRQRTIRTSIVSSVLPGAALDIEESRLFKRATGAGTLGGRGKRPAHNGDLSDSEDSDDSMPDSPAMSQLQGTARTRGMRGAASAAAQRMAAISGRSETPEAIIHHHETRTSRRFGREATREETEEPQQLIITLKVTPARLRKLFRDRDPRIKHSTTPIPSGSATPSAYAHSKTPGAGSMGPPSTPAASAQVLPSSSATPSSSTASAQQLGGVPAAPPPPPGEKAPPAPPPPQWLHDSLNELRREYPDDRFEGFMRHCAIDPKTDVVFSLAKGQKPPPEARYMYLPRIKCLDCPGKSYTAGPGMTATNFRTHLKNNNDHKRNVTRRRDEERKAAITYHAQIKAQQEQAQAQGQGSSSQAGVVVKDGGAKSEGAPVAAVAGVKMEGVEMAAGSSSHPNGANGSGIAPGASGPPPPPTSTATSSAPMP